MKFFALVVEPYTNSATANLLFADPETDPDVPAVLSFSRAIDIEGGTYYFEINDQSYSSYGGLKSVQLTRNSLQIELEQQVIEKFGQGDFQKVQVDYEIDDELYQIVLETMKQIFEGHEIFQTA